jgi:hypothetical protein
MIATLTDLSRFLYLPSKQIALAISGSTTSGDTISTADGQRYLQDAEAKIVRILGDVPFIYTRIKTAYTADATSVATDKINTDDWQESGFIFFNGMNVAYTGRTADGFSGLSSDYTIQAAPVGTFIISGADAGLVGFDEEKGYEAELYRLLEMICKEAAYNIWITRFPADDMPKVIGDWKKDVDRYLSAKSAGFGYCRP